MKKNHWILVCIGVMLAGIAGLYVIVKVVKWPLEKANPDGPVVDVEHEEIKITPDGPENKV